MLEASIQSLFLAIADLGRQDVLGAAALTTQALAFSDELSAALVNPDAADELRGLSRVLGPTCRHLMLAAVGYVPNVAQASAECLLAVENKLLAIVILAHGCLAIASATSPNLGAAAWQCMYNCVRALLGPGRVLLARLAVNTGGTPFAALLLEKQVALLDVLFQLAAVPVGDVGSFAEQMAPPRDLLAWLATFARAAQALHGASLGRGDSSRMLGRLAVCVMAVLTLKQFRRHAAQLCGDSGLQRTLVQLFTPAVCGAAVAAQLPPERRPAGWSWEVAYTLSDVLSSSALAMGLGEQLWEHSAGGGLSSGSWRLLQGAAQLVMSLPLVYETPQEEPGPATVRLWYTVVRLLGAVCALVDDAALARHVQHARQATVLLQQAVLRMPRSLQLMADEAAGMAAAESPSAGSAANAAARLCSDWCSIVKTLQPLLPAVPTMEAAAAAGAAAAPGGPSLAAVPAWCAAAGAMLRALPQVAAIYPLVEFASMSAIDEDLDEAPDELADLLLGAANSIAAACRHSARGSEAGDSNVATAQAAATAVWQLHTTCCRVVHWRERELQQRGADLPGVWGMADCCQPLTAVVVDSYFSTLSLSSCLLVILTRADREQANEERAGAVDDKYVPLKKQLQAMSVGHLEALLCMLDLGSEDREPGELGVELGTLAMEDAARTIVVAVKWGGLNALTPLLKHCLGALWLHVASDAWEAPIPLPVLMLVPAPPLLAAWLMTVGVLSAAVSNLAAWAAAASPLTPVCLGQTLDNLLLPVKAVIRAARELPAVPHNAAAVQHAAELDGVISLLQDRGGRADSWQGLSAVIARLQREALPLALELAAAVVGQEQTAEEVAAERLAAAQAAAKRSCAYLRCSNLNASGDTGPAAGPGNGSERCGGCRVVRYCGTACSHADWRAGHKWVCAALAAVRQEQQQQQQQDEQQQ